MQFLTQVYLRAVRALRRDAALRRVGRRVALRVVLRRHRLEDRGSKIMMGKWALPYRAGLYQRS